MEKQSPGHSGEGDRKDGGLGDDEGGHLREHQQCTTGATTWECAGRPNQTSFSAGNSFQENGRGSHGRHGRAWEMWS